MQARPRTGPDAPAEPQGPGAAGAPLGERLLALTAPGVLTERGEGGELRCVACAHRCVFRVDRVGACGVRARRGEHIVAPWGYVARRYVRSVEVNTIYHVKPGALALTFGLFGCDLQCGYCQNARISQALREDPGGEQPQPASPEGLVAEAVEAGCGVVCAAYNEPMIAAEWVRAIFAEARGAGLTTALVTDGHTTREALEYLRPVTDVFRVDLKGHSADQYRELGGRVGPVFEALRTARELGYWVEAVTLVVPGFNDDGPGLEAIARRVAEVDPDIPWHVNAFYPRHKLRHLTRTPALTLLSAAGAAHARGLRFVYVGNVDGEMNQLSHTRCPGCHRVLVERHGYTLRSNQIRDGRCPGCGMVIAGRWV